MVTSCLTTVWPGLGELAVAAGLPGQVHHHAAGLHRFDRRGGHQPRRGPARHQRGGDHHVEAADRLFQRLLLLGAFVVGELAGVPALTGRVDADIQPLRPHRTHLVGHLGTHVVAGGARAQPLGRRQRLQPGHADAEHQHGGRLHRSGGRRQHREEPGRLRRREQHGLVPGHVGLRRQRVHRLRPRDARDGLQRERLHTGLLQRADRVVGVAGRQKADQRLPAVQPADLVSGRRRDLDDDVGRPRIPDGGAGLGVELVGKQRPLARAGLDHDGHTAVDQRRDRLGYQRDAPLVGSGLGDHPDLDRHRLRICHGAYIYFP